MFLSGMQYTPSQFDYTVNHGVSCDRSAVEAEIGYLPGVDSRDVTVEMSGTYVLLQGTVASPEDASMIERVAQEIVGTNRVLSRLIATRVAPKFKILL